MLFDAKHYTLVNGIGTGTTTLNAFDDALLNSKTGNYNLVKVSSILPSNATERLEIGVLEGAVIPIAYSVFIDDNMGDIISAAVGVGIPSNNNNVGVIMELSGKMTEKEVKTKIEMMVSEAMEKRKEKIGEIKISCVSKAVEKKYTCVFSGVVLW